MRNKISLTNVSFNFLKGSSEFLNLVLNNISSCILLLDKKMELQAFNDVLTTIFSNRKGEDLLFVRCGEAIGCAYNVEEMKDCGKTSNCHSCPLRESVLISYYKDKPVYKELISREFYMHDGEKVLKRLQFSTRSFKFQEDKYIILCIDDITELVETKNKLKKLKRIQAIIEDKTEK